MIWLVGIPYLVLMFLLCFCEESEFDFGFSNLFITLEIVFILALNFFILFSQVVLFMDNKECPFLCVLIKYCNLDKKCIDCNYFCQCSYCSYSDNCIFNRNKEQLIFYCSLKI